MKKLIPFIVCGILAVGTFGCTDSSKNTAETPSTTSEVPVKDASQTTTAPKTDTQLKTELGKKLKESLPGSNLQVEETNGAVTIKGTVPTLAELKKIENLVKSQKGVKTVKVEAKVEAVKKP